jgi:membrane protease YdiL (CAAX protease family)
MKKAAAIFCALALCLAPICGQVNTIDKGSGFLNLLFPGSIQIAQGKTEGWWYTPGTALCVGGLALTGQSYLPVSPDAKWNNVLGPVVEKTGEMLFYYSFYAGISDADFIWPGYTRQALPDLLLAPWNPANLASVDVLPLVGIGLMTSLPLLFEPTRAPAIGDFFGRETVNMWGVDMNPFLAYGCLLGYSLVLCDINAVAEETLYRGIVSGQFDAVPSSAIFGLPHAATLLLKDITPKTVRDTTLQVINAFCLGLYLDNLVRESGGDLQTAIAMHHWWNVAALSLGFFQAISEPDYVRDHRSSANGESLSVSAYFDGDSHPGILLSYRY